MFRVAGHSVLAALAAFCAPAAFAADTYPQKPIRLVVPFVPGGATDVLARSLSEKLAEVLGVSVVVDNRGGAGGTLGTAVAAKAPPDGYTFLMTSPSHTFTPSIYKNLPYDPLKDFKAITKVADVPNILVVHPSLPVKNVKELIALARKHPGEIRFGSGGHGSNIHLTTELFAYKAKIKLAHVPYKGGGAAQIAVMSGEVQMLMAGYQSAISFVKAGRMRGLAVTTRDRVAAAPDIPTIRESGVPDYEKVYWAGFFAPAGVPDAIISSIHQALLKVMNHPDIAKRLAAEGAKPSGIPPAEFDAFVRAEITEWAKLIKELKI